MGIHRYSKPLAPLLPWASCWLSFNIRLAMGENFADSLAQHPVDTPSPSGKAEPRPAQDFLSTDGACPLTPWCAAIPSSLIGVSLSTCLCQGAFHPLLTPSPMKGRHSQRVTIIIQKGTEYLFQKFLVYRI